MEQNLMIARSITHAQRIERLLAESGIRCRVFHAPMELTGGRGCAYAIQVAPEQFANAKRLIFGAGLGPVSIFPDKHGRFQEGNT